MTFIEAAIPKKPCLCCHEETDVRELVNGFCLRCEKIDSDCKANPTV